MVATKASTDEKLRDIRQQLGELRVATQAARQEAATALEAAAAAREEAAAAREEADKAGKAKKEAKQRARVMEDVLLSAQQELRTFKQRTRDNTHTATHICIRNVKSIGRDIFAILCLHADTANQLLETDDRFGGCWSNVIDYLEDNNLLRFICKVFHIDRSQASKALAATAANDDMRERCRIAHDLDPRSVALGLLDNLKMAEKYSELFQIAYNKELLAAANRKP